MKLKTLIFLEFYMPPRGSMGMGSMSSQDQQLRPMPGSIDAKESWNGIVEGGGWFLYKESNDWHKKQATASVTITEGDPSRFRIKINTKGLRKKGDPNAMLYERIRRHVDKISKAWVSSAKKLHNNPELNEIGNPIQKSWNECFKEALQDPKVAPYIEGFEESKLSSISDPVNFTPRI
jgi:hypothetical protein